MENFDGHLDALLNQRQDLSKYLDTIMPMATAANDKGDKTLALSFLSNIAEGERRYEHACAVFIAKFGDRLTLKVQS